MSLLLLLNPKLFFDPGDAIDALDALRRKRRSDAELLEEVRELVEEAETLKPEPETPPELIEQKLIEYRDIKSQADDLRLMLLQREMEANSRLEMQQRIEMIELKRREIARLIVMLQEEEDLMLMLLMH